AVPDQARSLARCRPVPRQRLAGEAARPARRLSVPLAPAELRRDLPPAVPAASGASVMRLALVLVLCALASARAEVPDPRDQRVAYITQLLDALHASDPTTLADTVKYITAIERNNCRAPEQSLRVGCLLEAVAQNCRQREPAVRERCQRVSDVIVTNRLSEPV